MAITYYAQTANEKHWSAHWGRQQLSHLLAIAARDPLSRHLEAHLPTSGPILEGGCGLGQYVVYFRERGYDIIGGDFSPTALHIHRRIYPSSPLLNLDLRRMPFADGTFPGHISLGVIEHMVHGPQELLREFYRTLNPGGTLLVSVPWVNGARRLLGRLIRRRQAERRAAGATFYQYAFTRRELRGYLGEAGFTVCACHPYSPGRGLREILRLLRPARRDSATAATPGESVGARLPRPPRRGAATAPLRHLLYTPPVLWTFAHMILAVARKPVGG